MSRKATPNGNAQAESFIKTLKYEEVYLFEYEINPTPFLATNPNRSLLDGRSHGAIVTGARLGEDLESFLHTS